MQPVFNPTLTALRALRRVGETGSISATATDLGLTQSAISRAISNLEKSVGLTLVQRGVRPLHLTEEGRLVAAHAETIDRTLDTLRDRLAALKQHKAGSLTIGSFGASASARILPARLTAFAALYPQISVCVREAPDEDTLTDLTRGNIDIAVLSDPGEAFDVIPAAPDRLVALVPASDALAGAGELSAAELAGRPFVMPLGGSEPMILQWFASQGATPKIRHKILQTHSILAIVKAGLGLSVVTGLSLPTELSGVTAVPLKAAPVRDIVFARKYSVPASKAAAIFWDFLS
jgi:DNA-binding transcriptional LysR family regulator